jgi:hypothetical protein
MYITKSDYILWRECPHNVWIKKCRPKIYKSKPLSDFEKHLIEEGNMVEEEARKRFSGGILIANRGQEALDETQELLKNTSNTLFQAAFSDGLLFAAVDILKQDQEGNLSIYEVKASNAQKLDFLDGDNSDNEGDTVVDLLNPKEVEKYKKKLFKDLHFFDLAFQVCLARKTGHVVKNAYLVRLNKAYVREGDLDLNKLFVIEDVTVYIDEALPAIEEEIQSLIKLLKSNVEPKGPCCCLYKGRSKHCTTFSESNKDISDYSIHDLIAIGKSKPTLEKLIDAKIYDILDIPIDFNLPPKIKKQTETHRLGKPQIDYEFIRKELSNIQFPIYFLDYETFNPSIPRFTGFKPYQHIPFQFSLHRLDSPESELIHSDFFYAGDKDPSRDLIESLEKVIGDKGSIVVWNRTFEESLVNKRLAERLPEYSDFIIKLNARIYDLMAIFFKQVYIHPEFHGSYSIKKILPVLCGKTYDEMEIGNGSEAMNTWNRMVTTSIDEVEKTRLEKLMREYCEKDTLAMYDIWKVLTEIVQPEVL